MPLDKPIEEYMRRTLFFLDANESVLKASQVMKKNRVGSVIVTKGQKPVGIVTERDILYRVAAEGLSVSEVKLEEIMSSPIVTAPPNTTVRKALEIMDQHNFRRLVVVDNDKPIGLFALRTSMCPIHIRTLEEQNLPRDWLHKHLREVAEEVLERFE